jgi:hypothetical protein
MLDEHQRFENSLHAFARRHFPVGAFHFDFADVAKLGGGDLERGEQILHQMGFQMAGPRSVHPESLRQLGDGSISTGRRVLEKFLDRLHKDGKPQAHARGGAAKMTKEAAGYRNAIEDGQFCALCDMFAEPNGCSLVEGKISRTALCDHFEKA